METRKKSSSLKALLGVAFLAASPWGLAGCGNAEAPQTPFTPPPLTESATATRGTLTVVTSGIDKALETALGRLTTAALSAKSETTAGSLPSCVQTEGADGSLSIRCDCFDGEKVQGHVITTFKGGFLQDTCPRSDGTTGAVLSMNQAISMTFDHCVFKEDCGETITIDGTTNGSSQGFFNECVQLNQFENTMKTSESCSGLTTTFADGRQVRSGFSIDLGSHGGKKSIRGTICSDGESRNFNSLEELNALTDPKRECGSSEQEGEGKNPQENPGEDSEETGDPDAHPIEDPSSENPDIPFAACELPEGQGRACGDLTIRSQSDLDAAADCISADGLGFHIVNGPSLVSLPYLQKVGDVYLHQTSGIEMLDLPCLKTVSNFFYLHQNADLKTVNAPRLSSVGMGAIYGGYLYVYQNSSLETLRFDSLHSIGDYLYIHGNNLLETFRFDSLNKVYGDLSLYYHGVESVSFPLLEAVGGNFSLHQALGMMELDLPNLETVAGYLYFHQNDDLQVINAPLLTFVGDDVYMHQNSSLTTVHLDNLIQIGGHLYVYGNGSLATVQLDDLSQIGDYVYIIGNPLWSVPPVSFWSSINGGAAVTLSGNAP